MGLKPLYTGTEEETNWETFSRQVKRMNLLSGKGIQYKVFFFSSYATKDELVDGGRRRSSTAKVFGREGLGSKSRLTCCRVSVCYQKA